MARDEYSEKLSCPKCGRTGTADLSEADGFAYGRNQRTKVEFMPPGFKRVSKPDRPSGLDIYCEGCNVSARQGNPQ